MKQLGIIADLPELYAWVKKHQQIMTPTISRYAQGRRELWIKRKCSLQRKPVISQGYFDKRLYRLANNVLPNFDIGLFLYYPPHTQITPHKDHFVFNNDAVLINLGDATFVHDNKEYPLTDGVVWQFDCKVTHAIKPVSKDRYSFIFWTLKPSFRR